MQMPAAHKASLLLSLFRSLFFPFPLVPLHSEVFEFFLFTPEGRVRPRAPLFSTVHPFIGTPECLHCETGGVAGWGLARMSVS